MRKAKKITLIKEALRYLDTPPRRAAAQGTDASCVWEDIGQHTCAYSNCGSCTFP